MLYNKNMIMKLMVWIRKATNKKNYSLSKKLREDYNVEISVPGIDGYDKEEAKSMRLDVLCGFFKMTGVTGNEFMKRLCDEFLTKK